MNSIVEVLCDTFSASASVLAPQQMAGHRGGRPAAIGEK